METVLLPFIYVYTSHFTHIVYTSWNELEWLAVPFVLMFFTFALELVYDPAISGGLLHFPHLQFVFVPPDVGEFRDVHHILLVHLPFVVPAVVVIMRFLGGQPFQDR